MSKRSKALDGERISIIRKYVLGELSRAEASRKCGVSERTMARRRVRYQTEGAPGFLPRKKNRSYSPMLKEKAVKAYLSGEGSLLEICKKYKILEESQLRAWIRVYNGHKDFKKQTGGSRMTKGRETTQAERVAVAKACIAKGGGVKPGAAIPYLSGN